MDAKEFIKQKSNEGKPFSEPPNHINHLPFIFYDTVAKMMDEYVEKVLSDRASEVGVKPEVMSKIAEIKQKMEEHFDSESIILKNIKTEISDEEYEYRKAELKRQRFYVMLILINFSARPQNEENK